MQMYTCRISSLLCGSVYYVSNLDLTMLFLTSLSSFTTTPPFVTLAADPDELPFLPYSQRASESPRELPRKARQLDTDHALMLTKQEVLRSNQDSGKHRHENAGLQPELAIEDTNMRDARS